MDRQKMISKVSHEQTVKSKELNQIVLLEEVKITIPEDLIQYITIFINKLSHN